MAQVGSLIVRIGADLRGLRSGGSDAIRTLKGFSREAQQTIKRMSMLTAAATSAGLAITAALTKQGLAAVDAQAKLARQLDGTIGGLRGLQLAGNDAGVSAETMNSALEKLSARLGEAERGTGTAKRALDLLNLTTDDLAGKDIDERMATIADRVQELGLTGQQTAAILRDMGIRNTELVNLFREGGGAIRAAKEEVAGYGLALGEVDARKVEMANDAMARFGLITEGIKSSLAVEMAPILLGIAKRVNEAARESGGFREQIQGAMDVAVTGAGVLADGLRGVQVGFKAATLVAQGFGTGVLHVLSQIYEGWTRISREIVESLKALVLTVNRLPGIEIPVTGLDQLSSGLQSVADGQIELRQRIVESTAQTARELHDLMMQPLPSDGIKAWVEEAKILGQQLAEDLAAKAQTGAGGMLGGGDEGDGENPQQAALQARVEALRESLMTEEMLQRTQHQKQLEELAFFEEQKLLKEGEYALLREELQAQHMDRLKDIQQRGMSEMARFAAMSAGQQAKSVIGAFQQMSGAVDTESRKMFEVNKAASIASAIVNTAEGVTKALSAYPPPLSFAMAAAQAAAGFAQVNAIKSQSFRGGGGGAPAPSAGAVPAAGGAAGGRASSDEGQARNVLISMQDDMMRGLIGPIMAEIGEQLADGGRLGSIRVVG